MCSTSDWIFFETFTGNLHQQRINQSIRWAPCLMRHSSALNGKSGDLYRHIAIEELHECRKKDEKWEISWLNRLYNLVFRGLWTDIRNYLHRYVLHIQRSENSLPVFGEGIVTLIPKAPENAQKLKAWRSLSFLKVLSKILFARMARRIKSVLWKLIKLRTNYVSEWQVYWGESRSHIWYYTPL